MSQHDNALFHRDGSTWHPQSLSVGPWAPDALHGGPVAALCVSIAEELLPDLNFVTTRLTLDLVKPVPTQPLEVRGEIYKQGRRVYLTEVEIRSAGKTVALASVQRTLRQPVELPDLSNSRVRLTPPADRPDDFVPFDPEKMKVVPAPFLHHATDLRTPRAAALFERDPTEAWINVHANLLPGVPLSTAAAIVAAADYGNAIGAPLPPGPGLLFPNADLTVYLVRQPESAWVRMTPSTSWLPNGIGQTRCLLDDEQGMLGTSVVTLALANRT